MPVLFLFVFFFLPVAIVKKGLRVQRSLYETLRALSLTLLEKTSLFKALQAEIDASDQDPERNQLRLFDC
jgi:hypothetical protein